MGTSMRRIVRILVVTLLAVMCIPGAAFAADDTDKGYTVTTDWVSGTTTYTFSRTEDVSISSLSVDGDSVFDFSQIEEANQDEFNLYVTPRTTGSVVRIKGNPSIEYKVAITVNGDDSHLILEDFQTDQNLSFRGSGDISLTYDGACAFMQLFFGSNCDSATVSANDPVSHLSFDFVSDTYTNLTLSGSMEIDGGITCKSLTIKDAAITCTQPQSSNDYRDIAAPVVSIVNSTIEGVSSINSFRNFGNGSFADEFSTSSITISDSTITFDAKVFTGNSSSTVLGNSRTIDIDGSTIYGIETTDYGCLGGTFQTIDITGSEIHAKSYSTAAIGPSSVMYGRYDDAGIDHPTITIKNSTIDAASTFGAAIGMPWFSMTTATQITDACQLGISISGSSDITATSVASAAIGSGARINQKDVPADGVEIEVGAGDITWGSSSTLSLLGSVLDLLSINSGSQVEQDVVKAAGLQDGCTLAISGNPTIAAKSGSMAIYADQVDVTGTNVVQTTMVYQNTDDAYVPYTMEAPGSVTTSNGTSIGELGYGYASVATTGVDSQTGTLKFGGSSLTNVDTSTDQFTITGTGINSFFATPTLDLSGSVALTKSDGSVLNGSAAVGDVLKVNLSELKPSKAALLSSGAYEGLDFAWHRNGTPIDGATNPTYTLTDADNNAVITCVVSGKGFFKGSVTSDAVTVTARTAPAAPKLDSRTTTSITLANAGTNYTYQLVGEGTTWQTDTTFSNLQPGTSYTFVQKDSTGSISAPATFMTLSNTPDQSDFAIDYVNESLSFPAGVNLYANADCTKQLNANSSKLSIGISDHIGSTATTLYARYATADPTDTVSVTQIEIPARPDAPTLNADEFSTTASTISFTGKSGVAYRLLVNGSEVKRVDAATSASTVQFDNLSPATVYTLEARLEASNGANGHFRSDIASITISTAAAAPDAPAFSTNAQRTGEGYESVTVGFSWSVSNDNGATIDGYTIYAKTTGESATPIEVAKVTAGQTTYETNTITTTALTPGQTYEFYLEVDWSASDGSNGKVESEPASVKLPNLLPDPGTFTIGYASETLTVPNGVNLYADADCTQQITLDAGNTASITNYIAEGTEPQNSLYARYATADGDTEAVTEIGIPKRESLSLDNLLDMTITYNSIYVREWYNDQSLTLIKDESVIEPSSTNNVNGQLAVEWENLDPNTTYTLHKRKAAVEPIDGSKGSFASETSREITTKVLETKTETILILAGGSSTREYDLSSNLDGATISKVSEAADPNYILSSTSVGNTEKTSIELCFSTSEIGESATVKVEAQKPDNGDYLHIEITVRAVDALAESNDGTLWVRSELTDDQQAVVETALASVSSDDATLETSFALTPTNPLGGSMATDADAQSVTVNLDGVSGDGAGTYSVYRIDPDTSAATPVSATRSGTSITFEAEGSPFWYGITYTEPEPESHAILVDTAEGGALDVAQNALAGQTVTITPKPSAGFELNGISVTSGSSSVSTTEQSDGTFTFTMSDADVRITAEFAAITPAAPVLTAKAGETPGTIDVSWTQSTDNGAVITSYKLAVTSAAGQAVTGSPFEIASGQTTYQLTSLTQGATYTFQLTSCNHDATAVSNAVQVELPEPEAPQYTVTIAEGIEHGTVSVSLVKATEGTDVTITATPDEGFTLESVSVVADIGAEITPTQNDDGTYGFTMPDEDVTVSAVFKQKEPEEETDDKDLNANLDQVLEDAASNIDALSLKTGAYVLTDNLSVKGIASARDVELMTDALYIGMPGQPATVDLDLKGYSIYAATCAIIVAPGSTLNLYDSGSAASGDDVRTGSISGKSGLQYTSDGKTYVYAGGVAVYGTFSMFGGSITGNTAIGDYGYGGGVYVFGGGTFNMFAGEISGNTATTLGGGVAVRSAADTTPAPNVMSVGDAEIEDWQTVDGGDVIAGLSVGLDTLNTPAAASFDSSDGTFNLYGGTITGNEAPVGAGVHVGGKTAIATDSAAPASITVSGNKKDNLYVPAGMTVALTAAPASGSKIGVTMEQGSGKFASSDADTARNALARFTSDNGSYYVSSQSDGLVLEVVVVPPPSYEPEVDVPGGGGTVTIDPAYPNEDDKVTITPVPDEGMTVGEVSVTDQDGEPVDLTDNGDGTWTFVQPAGDVTITVTFICDGGAYCPSSHLPDVDQSLWYHLSVDWAVSTGTLIGYDDGTFGPDNNLTRAEMATVLWRIAGEPAATYELPEDCDTEAFYADAVTWALSEGVFHGYGDGSTFGPNDPLTREQAACVLKNSADRLGIGNGEHADLSSYPDAGGVSDWAQESLAWAVANGVLHGFELEDGTRELQPLRPCTRAEMAALLMNLSTCK